MRYDMRRPDGMTFSTSVRSPTSSRRIGSRTRTACEQSGTSMSEHLNTVTFAEAPAKHE